LTICALIASFLFWSWGEFNLDFALSYSLFFALINREAELLLDEWAR